MPEPEISFITVNYCTPDLVGRLIDSIHQFPPPLPYEIIVVDNKSPDNSSDLISKFEKDFRFLPLEKNFGFGTGNNRGAEIARGRIIVLINSDCELKTESFAGALEYLEANPDVGIVGLKIYRHDGELEQTARGFPDASTGLFGRSTTLGKLAQKFGKTGKGGVAGKNLMVDPDATEPYTVDWVSGALMVIKRECWDAIGGFDEDYFMYWEDADLCYRAKKAGFRTGYYPGASVTHRPGSSSSKNPCPAIGWFHESAYLYICKHVSPGPSFLRGFAWCALNARAALLKVRARKKTVNK